ncbi:hypothetical protein BJ944DRAFT_160490 [Cunninghamella echinulata]|nr:hypothetical protein BJ944DRAFT_160490 [Cunninghamella echinulata]
MYDSDDDDIDCPLCMEELDIADRNFRPCTCGYQICRFCWHHIKENLNGRCPACRREYSDQMVEFQPISADEISRIKREKKEKERQQKDMEAVNRRHLANMRVVQKNLVYVIGLHPKYATEEIIRSNDYFGQFGKIAKVVINKRNIAPTTHVGGSTSLQPSAAIYVTYQRKEDADKAIQTVDGHTIAGRILRASYGTTKYCTYYLRNMTCPNPSCLYLHEPGEEADTISKEELATGKHRMRDQMSTDDEHRPNSTPSSSSSNSLPTSSHAYQSSPSITNHDFPPVGQSENNKPNTTTDQNNDDERSALPATASWAKIGNGSNPSTPVLKSTLPERTLTPDNFGPPLSVAAASSQKQPPPQSPSAMKRKIEKKKRKELQKNRDSLNKSKITSTPSSSIPSTPTLMAATTSNETTTPPQPQPTKTINDAVVHFVLGDAIDQVGWIPQQHQEEDDDDVDNVPLGVSSLYQKENDDDDREEDENKQEPVTPPSTSNLLNERLQSLTLGHALEANDDINTLDFLLNAIPTPTYRGSFNPFAHQILRTTGNLFESPMRKTSRFGFAQI